MWIPIPPWMIQRLKERGTCPESVLELAQDTIPKTLEEAEGRLKCGDIPGAIEALFKTIDSIQAIKNVLQFYHENICQQAGQPIAHLAPYEPPPPEEWRCSEKAQRFLETEVWVEHPLQPERPLKMRIIDYIQALLDRVGLLYEQLKYMIYETKQTHEQCMENPTTECWETYKQKLREAIELTRRTRNLIGRGIRLREIHLWMARIYYAPIFPWTRPPPPPEETLRRTTRTSIINTLGLLLETFNRIQPEVFMTTYFTPDRINRTARRWIRREKEREEEAKRRMKYYIAREDIEEERRFLEQYKKTVTEVLNRLKKLCTPPNQLAAGICQEWTKRRINTRARELREMLEKDEITRDRFNMFIKELEEKCIELGGRWDGTRCR